MSTTPYLMRKFYASGEKVQSDGQKPLRYCEIHKQYFEVDQEGWPDCKEE